MENMKEQLLELMNSEEYKPMTTKELEDHFEMTEADDFKELVKTLVSMEDAGAVVRSRSNRYGVPSRMNLIVGSFIGHAKGFGFVTPEESGMDDIFIPLRKLTEQ